MNTNPEWKLVPATMTLDMCVAFAEAWFSKVRCIDDPEMQDAYAAMLSAAPEAPPLTVTVDPDARGVSVGVYQGPRCVYSGAHPIPASTVATEGEKDEQAAFERWLDRTCPSGDVEAVQRQWEASSDYADLHAPAAGDALDRDQQRLALWQAIRDITIGNLHDDKLILANLHKAGYVIALAAIAQQSQLKGDA